MCHLTKVRGEFLTSAQPLVAVKLEPLTNVEYDHSAPAVIVRWAARKIDRGMSYQNAIEEIHLSYTDGEFLSNIMEEKHLHETFLPREIIRIKSPISRLGDLDVWFQWNIDDLSLFDRWLKTH